MQGLSCNRFLDTETTGKDDSKICLTFITKPEYLSSSEPYTISQSVLVVILNEDLTVRRAMLAHEARKLKKAGKISDTWTYMGKILIKDSHSRVVQIEEKRELEKYN